MVLEENNLFLDENLSTKEEVLEFISKKAEKLGITKNSEGLLKNIFGKGRVSFQQVFKMDLQYHMQKVNM